MACGSGASRDYLSSAPTDPATLFTRAYVVLSPTRAVPAAPVVVRLPPASPRSKKWGGKDDEQMFYSRAQGKSYNDAN